MKTPEVLAVVPVIQNVPFDLRKTYSSSIFTAGFSKIHTANANMDTQTIRDLYDTSDAVLFVGGGDINPNLYGQTRDSKTDIPDTGRDELELMILGWVMLENKPFLGICRGAQMLAIHQGAQLIQDIPVDSVNHHTQTPSYDGLKNNSHAVYNTDGKLIYPSMPSMHHQAIDPSSLPSSLELIGVAQDDIIEIVHSDHTPIWGYQGHIEASPLFQHIFVGLYLNALSR